MVYIIINVLDEESKKKMYLFNSFFYEKLSTVPNFSTTQRHEKVKRWTKKNDIFEKDFIFIPINQAK